jgi:hypothetical protein
LETEQVTITVSNEIVYLFVIDISTGNKSREEIVEWLKANSQSLK